MVSLQQSHPQHNITSVVCPSQMDRQQKCCLSTHHHALDDSLGRD